MLWCLSCLRPGDLAVCQGCVSTMRSAPWRRLECGIGVSSGLVHQGAARRLVLRLKYRGCREAAVMLPFLPSDALALVPIPRIYSRRLKYRSDPGFFWPARSPGVRACRPASPSVRACGVGRTPGWTARPAPPRAFDADGRPLGDWCWSTTWSPPAGPWGRRHRPWAAPWFWGGGHRNRLPLPRSGGLVFRRIRERGP